MHEQDTESKYLENINAGADAGADSDTGVGKDVLDSSRSDILPQKVDVLISKEYTIPWDLVTAYRLNTKLLRKYDRALKSLDCAIERNRILQEQLRSLNKFQFSTFVNEEKNKQHLSATRSSKSGIEPHNYTFVPHTLLEGRCFHSSRANLMPRPNLNTNTDLNPSSKTKAKGGKGEVLRSELGYFRDSNGNIPSDNADTIRKKRHPPIVARARKWTEEDKMNLAFGIKQQNKQILVNSVLNSVELGPDEKKKKIEKINKLKPRKLEMNLEGLDWKVISKLYVKTHKPSACAIYWATQGHPIINKARWTKAEIEKLEQLVESHNGCDWVSIARELNTNRTAVQCFKLYQRKINPKLTLSKWTAQEDEMLKSLVQMYGEGNWQAVASSFYGRSAQQVLHRWYKSINPNLKQGKWTPDEDGALLVGVKIFGVGKWNKIAEFVPGRTDVKCRERYVNVLSPNVKRGKWTPCENLRLISAVCKVGIGKWTAVSEMVGGRSDNQCWRHWLSLNRRGLAPDPTPNTAAALNLATAEPVQVVQDNLNNVEASKDYSCAPIGSNFALQDTQSAPMDPRTNTNGSTSAAQRASITTSITDNLSVLSMNSLESTSQETEYTEKKISKIGKAVLKRNAIDRDLVGVEESVSKKRRWKRINSNNDSSIENKIEDTEIQEYVPDKIVQYFSQIKSVKSGFDLASDLTDHSPGHSQGFDHNIDPSAGFGSSSNKNPGKKSTTLQSNHNSETSADENIGSGVAQSSSAFRDKIFAVLQNQLFNRTDFAKIIWENFFNPGLRTESPCTGKLVLRMPPNLAIMKTLHSIATDHPELLDSFNKGLKASLSASDVDSQGSISSSILNSIKEDLEAGDDNSNSLLNLGLESLPNNERVLLCHLEKIFLMSLLTSALDF